MDRAKSQDKETTVQGADVSEKKVLDLVEATQNNPVTLLYQTFMGTGIVGLLLQFFRTPEHTVVKKPVMVYNVQSDFGQAGYVTAYKDVALNNSSFFLSALFGLTVLVWVVAVGTALFLWKKKEDPLSPLQQSHLRTMVFAAIGLVGTVGIMSFVMGAIVPALLSTLVSVTIFAYVYMMFTLFNLWQRNVKATNKHIKKQMKDPPLAKKKKKK